MNVISVQTVHHFDASKLSYTISFYPVHITLSCKLPATGLCPPPPPPPITPHYCCFIASQHVCLDLVTSMQVQIAVGNSDIKQCDFKLLIVKFYYLTCQGKILCSRNCFSNRLSSLSSNHL